MGQSLPPLARIMVMMIKVFLLLSIICYSSAERIQVVSTHTSSCFSCGMFDGTSYLTVKICGSDDCCLSRSLDNEGELNWLPGQTDHFTGWSSLRECADYEL